MESTSTRAATVHAGPTGHRPNGPALVGAIERALADVAQYRAGLVQVRLTHPGTPRAEQADAHYVALDALVGRFEPGDVVELTSEHMHTIGAILVDLGLAATSSSTPARRALAERWRESVTLLRIMAPDTALTSTTFSQ